MTKITSAPVGSVSSTAAFYDRPTDRRRNASISDNEAEKKSEKKKKIWTMESQSHTSDRWTRIEN